MNAVQQDGLSLLVASFRLRADLDIALAALSRDRESIVAVCEPLRSEAEFLRRAYWASSLDCRPEARLSGTERSTFEQWDLLLYQNNGVLSLFYCFLHEHLR